jgi:hypothetical protein
MDQPEAKIETPPQQCGCSLYSICDRHASEAALGSTTEDESDVDIGKQRRKDKFSRQTRHRVDRRARNACMFVEKN